MLKLYNTLTNKKEEFTPLKKGEVSIYNCGPTVYSAPHIGNLRRYIMSDILRRYLEYRGYTVKEVTNITDVGHLTDDEHDQGEDKITEAAKKEAKTPEQIAEYYEDIFRDNLNKLRIKEVDSYPHATAYVEKMISAVKILMEKGFAYETSKGIYFDITKFPKYGQLSGNRPEDVEPGARVDVDKEKKNPQDFALWIKADPKHLMQWDSPWGKGYPGWHIECSVMSRDLLGDTIDIHTGGEDNIFPHHESEIAQSESITGKPFVRFWIHARHLQLAGKKMAKSEGKLYTLDDLEKKGYTPREFRYLSLTSHYRSKLNFSFKSLDQARKNLRKIDEYISQLQKLSDGKEGGNTTELIKSFEQAMDDDLSTPEVLAHLFSFITKTNQEMSQSKVSPKLASNILSDLDRIDYVLAVIFSDEKSAGGIPDGIKKLADKREQARKNKDFAQADKLRKMIKERGYDIRDTEAGAEIKQIIVG